MSLSWNVQDEKPVGMIADRTLCLDKTASKLVPEGSVESAYQLVNAGREIPADEVARLGLVMVDGRVEQASAQADGDAGSAAEGEVVLEEDQVGHGQDEG